MRISHCNEGTPDTERVRGQQTHCKLCRFAARLYNLFIDFWFALVPFPSAAQQETTNSGRKENTMNGKLHLLHPIEALDSISNTFKQYECMTYVEFHDTVSHPSQVIPPIWYTNGIWEHRLRREMLNAVHDAQVFYKLKHFPRCVAIVEGFDRPPQLIWVTSKQPVFSPYATVYPVAMNTGELTRVPFWLNV